MNIENKKLKWKGGTLLAPLPAVMVSCGTMEKPNIITIGWTGILCSDPPKTYVSVRPERYSHSLIKETGKFVINLTTEELIKATDFCGVRSGRDNDKFALCKLTAVPAHELSDTPVIAECPISLECKVTDVIPLGSHDMFMADIVAVNVDEELFDKDDKMRLDKANLVAYAHGEYYELGKKIGKFGFSTNKKKKKHPSSRKENKK